MLRRETIRVQGAGRTHRLGSLGWRRRELKTQTTLKAGEMMLAAREGHGEV